MATGPPACAATTMCEYPVNRGGFPGSAGSIASDLLTTSTSSAYVPGGTLTTEPAAASATMTSSGVGASAVPNRVRWYVYTILSPSLSNQHAPRAPPSWACTAAVSSAAHAVRIGTTSPPVLLT